MIKISIQYYKPIVYDVPTDFGTTNKDEIKWRAWDNDASDLSITDIGHLEVKEFKEYKYIEICINSRRIGF